MSLLRCFYVFSDSLCFQPAVRNKQSYRRSLSDVRQFSVSSVKTDGDVSITLEDKAEAPPPSDSPHLQPFRHNKGQSSNLLSLSVRMDFLLLSCLSLIQIFIVVHVCILKFLPFEFLRLIWDAGAWVRCFPVGAWRTVEQTAASRRWIYLQNDFVFRLAATEDRLFLPPSVFCSTNDSSILRTSLANYDPTLTSVCALVAIATVGGHKHVFNGLLASPLVLFYLRCWSNTETSFWYFLKLRCQGIIHKKSRWPHSAKTSFVSHLCR